MEERDVILEVNDISKIFNVKSKKFFEPAKSLKAVNSVSFDVMRGETVGVIGESGCGKSTLGKTILKLINPTSGDVLYNGKSIMNLSTKQMNDLRREINIIFQDPYSSLDPRKTAGYLIEEPMIIHGIGTAEERKERVVELLKLVGLDYYHATRYPHEFSGGQRQRINIARALAMDVQLLVCDEAVSALDVSVQAQVLNLLSRLKKELNLTYIFISHDLSVVKYISDRIIIMYMGRIVEIGEANEIYSNPLHPYTKALFSAIPPENPFEKSEPIELQGEVPSPFDLPKGCAFSNRCMCCKPECLEISPELDEVEKNHQVACLLYE